MTPVRCQGDGSLGTLGKFASVLHVMKSCENCFCNHDEAPQRGGALRRFDQWEEQIRPYAQGSSPVACMPAM